MVLAHEIFCIMCGWLENASTIMLKGYFFDMITAYHAYTFMSEFSKDSRRKDVYLSSDCIDSALNALSQDPKSEIVFAGGHAYQIRLSANKAEEVVNLPLRVHIAGQDFPVTVPFQQYSAGELRKKIQEGEAMNITNLIKRLKRK